MKNRNNISIAILMLVLLGSLLSCSKNSKDKELNERLTIWRKDKIPYGTFYAFEQLPRLFPQAEIIIDKESPLGNSNNIFKPGVSETQNKIAMHQGKVFQVIMAPTVEPTPAELDALLRFVYNGNQLFITSFEMAKILLDTLNLKTSLRQGQYRLDDSLYVSIINPVNFEKSSYTYPGRTFDNGFLSVDTEYVRVLGRDHENRPNFVKISYESGGAIYIHLAPLAFSNFFLLHKNNKTYYDLAMSNVPANTELVVWAEYYRSHYNGEGEGGRPNGTARIFSWMMKQPPLLWALVLLLLLFLLIYLFESKRRQREIAERKPLRNASLDFVKTIGSLYYQRRDNKNLAGKMTAHFQDHVRSKYNIPTSRMDKDFEMRLAYKTGIDPEVISNIVYQAKFLLDQDVVSDTELMNFDEQLRNFYKKV